MVVTIAIIVLTALVIGLALFNWKIHVELNSARKVEDKIKSLNILQELMSTAGDTMSVQDKINKINDIIIEEYNIKYSTIVEFDGAKYIVRASNVDKKHWENLRNLQSEEIFRESIRTGIPQYLTVDKERDRLVYQKSEFGRAKSALFYPLCIDNVCVGYWIIESGELHAFDNIDRTILELVQNNIISVLKIVNYQNIVESLTRDDYYSALKSGEYLYNEGRKQIDKYLRSTICMFRITNLEEINRKINRETGNQVIIDMCDYIKENLSEEYIFVRYMGPKFVIAFSGVELEAVHKFVSDLKLSVEKLKIKKVENEKSEQNRENSKEVYAKIKLNFILGTYFKGTALEKLLKEEEEYLDNAPENENTINKI